MTTIQPPDTDLEAALHSVIDLNGPALLFEPDRLRRSLEAHCPDQPGGIELLLMALDEQVPQSLLGAHTEDEMQRLMPQSIDRLVATGFVEPEQARWAVTTWAQAIKLQPAPVPELSSLPERSGVDGLMPRAGRTHARPRWLAIAALVVVAIAAAISFRGGPGRTSMTSAATDAAFTDLAASPSPLPLPASAPVPSAGEASARGPVVNYIQLPRELVTGKPFVITVGYEPSGAPVDRIRAAVVDGTLRLGSEATRIEARVDPATAGPANTLTVPFDAIDEAARGTLAITLVDGSGRESEPKSIALEVQAQPRIAVESCSLATCGRVVSVRESRDRNGARAYETIIRMDNRTIHTVVQPAAWKPGHRVRLVSGRFVAMRGDPQP